MLKTRLYLDIVTVSDFFLFTRLRRTQISFCALYAQVLVVVLLPKNLVFHVPSGNTNCNNWNFHFPVVSEKILKIHLYCNSVYLWSVLINSFIFKGTLVNIFAKALCNYNIRFKQRSGLVFFIQTSIHNSSFIYIL